MELDIKDRRILAELDLNARATFQEIGKKTRLSKETVIYRVKNLERRGIIERYNALVNFAQLGYTGFGVYNRYQNVNEESKKEIIGYLKSIPELYWIALVGGKYDLVFGIMAKSVFQFNKIYYKILTKYGKYLVDNTIAIRTELWQMKKKYLSDGEQKISKPPFFGKEPTPETLDELDSDVLSYLSENARIPLVELSKTLNKPASTISLRMRELNKRGIIQGYSTYIRPQRYGLQSYRLLLNLENMDESLRRSLFSYALSNRHIVLAIETVGSWNFEISLEVENPEILQEEISSLRDSFSHIIRNIEFLIMFEDDLVYDPYPLKKGERKNAPAKGKTKALKTNTVS